MRSKLPHLLIEGFTETERYRRPGSGRDRFTPPVRNRSSHGSMLREQLATVKQHSDLRKDSEGEDFRGIQVEFESFPAIELAVRSLARERSGIELLNVRHEEAVDAAGGTVPEKRTLATVFVPDGKLGHFDKTIRAYLTEKKDSRGKPRDHRRLVDAIQAIRIATLRSLWTGRPERFPRDEDQPVWWEAWLLTPDKPEMVLARVRELASAAGVHLADGAVLFPERTVVLLKASLGLLRDAFPLVTEIAELRSPAETAEVFDSMTASEQAEWMLELLERTSFQGTHDAPHICLLDTGVNRGHQLISPALSVADLHTVNPGWGVEDQAGHGTRMAGLALMGDLAPVLASTNAIQLRHRLESVKILPLSQTSSGGPDLHGHLTSEAIARPEITAPARTRVFAMAVSARNPGGRGRPSAWSATIDRLAAGAEHASSPPRLFSISSGKSHAEADRNSYPDILDTATIQDPGQAWNALTIGAYTELDQVPVGQAPGATAIAPHGALSPFTMTSVTWQRTWPTKPDVVFEGGNRAQDGLSAFTMPGLGLLTTNHQPQSRLFTTATGTSPATALAARMAAQVIAEYPEYWPETIRGLVVHAADWTPQMRKMYLPRGKASNKVDYRLLLRRCGFGVPALDTALWSASNSLSLVAQRQMQPFRREPGKEPTANEMHLHRLPWPTAALESLGGVEVEMRVTLSYFIEPNPSTRGRSRYLYESHGLRFDLRRPTESLDEFRSRVNLLARSEGYEADSSGDPNWLIGVNERSRGSVHSDIWRGSAVELANRGIVAVFPVTGWWKTRTRLRRYNANTRYSLIVSIRAPETETDLYAEVSTLIPVATPVNV